MKVFEIDMGLELLRCVIHDAWLLSAYSAACSRTPMLRWGNHCMQLSF